MPTLALPTLDDAALVAALSGGNRDALAALYDRFAPMLLAVGMRILGERRDSEDVVHEVFVEAWKHAAAYDAERGTVRAWLVTRMRSRALDRVKSAGRSRSVPLDDAPVIAAKVAEDGGDNERLRVAMLTLPDEQRAVLELGYFEGLSSSEIAERQGVAVGTVKSRVAAAMAKLRAAMGAA